MKAADAIAMARERRASGSRSPSTSTSTIRARWIFFDPQAYWQAYEPYRGDNLRLGIEIGMNEAILEGNLHFLEQEPFDLVIGSQHIVDGQDIYYPAYYEGKSKEAAFHRYYELMAENVRRYGARIDVLGHIDYISRYAPYDDPEVSYGAFQEDIDRILRAAIETDTVLELNTRRLGSRTACKGAHARLRALPRARRPLCDARLRRAHLRCCRCELRRGRGARRDGRPRARDVCRAPHGALHKINSCEYRRKQIK